MILDFEVLIRQTSSKDVNDRSKAKQGFIDAGQSSIDSLMQELHKSALKHHWNRFLLPGYDWYLVFELPDILAEIGGIRAFSALGYLWMNPPILRNNSEDSEFENKVHTAAVKLLSKKPGLLSDIFDELSSDKEPRNNHVFALGAARWKPAISNLLLILENRDLKRSLRGAAANALGEIGEICAVQALKKCMTGDDLYVAGWSAWALGKCGYLKDPTVTGALIGGS